MARQLFSQNSNIGNFLNNCNLSKKKLAIIITIIVIIIITIIAVTIISQPSPAQLEQQKIIASATAAAQKQTPNAKVRDVKTGGGFAISTVSDPAAQGQANSGSTTVFKINKDGSMTQIAKGSYISPIDLLELGIPISTQATLTGQSVDTIKQTIANICGYNDGDTPGYNGFNGTFYPKWQIDPTTLNNLKNKINIVLRVKNADLKSDNKIICINAIQSNSNFSINSQTHISTFTLNAQFITKNGALDTHTITFAVGPNYYRSYTLDGQKL